jgi:hypothetical protein
VRLFMEQFAQTELHRQKQLSPTLAETDEESDLARFVPGVRLVNRIMVPNWPPGYRACDIPACLDKPPLNGIALPYQTGRQERPGAGGKLLIISDSFGALAASTLIEYFADIIDINMNNFPRLQPEERRTLWHRVTTEWQPDAILMVLQDGDVTEIPRFADPISDAAGP